MRDEQTPEAEVVRVVPDDLETIALGSLFAFFSFDEIRRSDGRLESRFTPK